MNSEVAIEHFRGGGRGGSRGGGSRGGRGRGSRGGRGGRSRGSRGSRGRGSRGRIGRRYGNRGYGRSRYYGGSYGYSGSYGYPYYWNYGYPYYWSYFGYPYDYWYPYYYPETDIVYVQSQMDMQKKIQNGEEEQVVEGMTNIGNVPFTNVAGLSDTLANIENQMEDAMVYTNDRDVSIMERKPGNMTRTLCSCFLCILLIILFFYLLKK